MDRIGILATQRLQLAYSESTLIPYSVKEDAFSLYSQSNFDQKNPDASSDVIYRQGLTCYDNTKAPSSIIMLKYIWEQAIHFDIGKSQDLEAYRIIFLYRNNVCVYPAESL